MLHYMYFVILDILVENGISKVLLSIVSRIEGDQIE